MPDDEAQERSLTLATSSATGSSQDQKAPEPVTWVVTASLIFKAPPKVDEAMGEAHIIAEALARVWGKDKVSLMLDGDYEINTEDHLL